VPEAFDLPEATRLVDLHHETPAEVDDIVAKTSDGGWIFVQAKGGKVEASGALARPLGKAASQFVRQFIVCAQKRGEDVFDTRPLDERDRLVVACDAQASQRVGVDLSRALQVLRSEGEDSPRYRDLSERCTRALDRLKGLVREAYKQATQQALSPADELQILRLVRIWWLPQGADEVAKHLLRQVIADPPRAPDAWSALHELAGQKSAARGSLDDRTLRQYLQDRGISLQGEVDHRLAQDALARASDRARGNLARHAHIQLADRELKIDREVLEPALAAARSRSLLIVGAPGEGKSGLLHAIGTALGDEGREVIFLEADAPLQVLESRLGAYLVDVLSGWRGSAAPVLLIDALDACREPQARYEWRRLIGSLPSTLAPPTIVATIRVFDLRYDVALRALFPGKPVLGESREPLLSSVRHLWMQPLSEQELSAVADRWRPLREFLGACSPELRQLVRTPFHLRILCDLLDRGQDDASTLRGIASEVQLLDRYWDWRVDSDDSGRQQADHAGCRMRTLASLGSTMVKQQRLKLEDTGEADPEAISELLRAGLLMREENTLSFAHHLLADYAFERVVLGKDAEALASQLLERRADCIFLATSLRLRLERWWIERRNEYWRLVEALAERSSSCEPQPSLRGSVRI
jgi:hypothetical protein